MGIQFLVFKNLNHHLKYITVSLKDYKKRKEEGKLFYNVSKQSWFPGEDK